MAKAAEIEQQPPPPPPTSVVSQRSEASGGDRRFARLRGVRWRVNLGILPSAPSSSIDDYRRVTADSRRRYAALRRRLLVDPHVPKIGSNSPDIAIDNPLSQNPDSTWGRFFRNAELEKTVDQDLSRLYPEHGSYFQATGCQGMLRRILLLWCLRHPEFGYRQGMHELLAPLVYVLHVDLESLSEVRKNYEDHFTDRFDELAFQESDGTYKFDFKKISDSMEDEIGSHGSSKKVKSLEELDPEIQAIVLLSDAYGAEGELGVVLSEKFMEHDGYCMFDALMSGAHGSIAMADFFSHTPSGGSFTGLPPVIEASAALYHLLSMVDSSLYSHLVELGVEPQYFALRWLRVLFGREFSLEDLLIVWDEILSAENNELEKDVETDLSSCFRILSSPRGALISAMAVTMILYLRSSLLATEHATSALQRLLNFPENVELRKIIDKAKSLQTLALDVNTSSASPTNGAYHKSKVGVARGHSLSVDLVSQKTPLTVVPESYWEEKWRVLNKAEELRQSNLGKEENPTRKKGWSERVRLRLSRTEFDPSSSKVEKSKRGNRSFARRSLLEDLSQQLGSKGTEEKAEFPEAPNHNSSDNNQLHVTGPSVLTQNGHHSTGVEEDVQNSVYEESNRACEESSSGDAAGEEHSNIFSDIINPPRAVDYIENDSGRSSVASNLSHDDNDANDHEEIILDACLPVSQPPINEFPKLQCKNDARDEAVAVFKERKFLSGKFQWLWKFGRNALGDEASDTKGSVHDTAKSTDSGSSKSNVAFSSTAGCIRDSSDSSKGDVDQNVISSLRNLGQSMLEHIQVIESVFQQDHNQVASSENLSRNGLVEKGQVTAMTALKELRKISNLLSEM